MWEIALLIIAGLFLVSLLLLLLIFILARWRPEALQRPLLWMRKFPFLRKRIDSASARALAKNTDSLLEELPSQAKKTLEKSLSGRSEGEKAALLEEVQRLAEAGKPEEAARALQRKNRDPRQKDKAVQKRRQKRKAARRQRKKR